MKMSEIDLEAYFNKHNIPEPGRELYRRTKLAPSRLVTEGGALNQCSAPFSEKMGCTIQSESKSGEYPAIYEFDMDDDVIEFYDQMAPVKIRGLSASGKVSVYTVRVDFLVARKSGIEAIEVKADSFIDKKLEQNHPSWTKDSNGEIHHLHLEDHFSKLGIIYRIRATSSFNKILLENNKLLLTSRRYPPPPSTISKKILNILRSHACLPMREIMHQCNIIDVTSILQLIDKREIFFEKEYEFLDDMDNVFLSLSPDLSRHFRSLRLQKRMSLEMIHSEVTSIPSYVNAEKALKKLSKLEQSESSRSIQRWRKQIREGEKKGISDFESILTRDADKGNRDPKRAPIVNEMILEAIKKYYAVKRRPTVTSAYIRYRKYAAEKYPAEEPVCERTFRIKIREQNPMWIGYKRGGKKMMHANAPTTALNLRSLKAKVAFSKAHFDHHVVKCWIIWGADKDTVFIGRPLLSLLIDEPQDKVLAWHFTFAKPSRVVDACVIRACVRRYGMLPEEIFTDHGSDFTSVYFRSLLASEKVTLSFREKGKSHAGSEVERIFGQFMKTWLCQREGNIVDKHAARAIDGNFSSKKHVLLKPENLVSEFEDYINFRENKLIGNKTETISKKFEESKRAFACVGRKVTFDSKFIVATAVEAKEYTIERNSVKIDGVRYSHPLLKDAKKAKAKFEVRIEPENPYIVYAFVGNKWITCTASGYLEFMEKTNVNQQVETLKIRGAGSLRGLAKRKAQGDLADLFDSADQKLLWVDENDLNEDDHKDIKSLFAEACSEPARILETEEGVFQ